MEIPPISIHGTLESLGIEELTSYPNFGTKKYYAELSVVLDSNNENSLSTSYQTPLGRQKVYISKEQYNELKQKIAKVRNESKHDNISTNFRFNLEFKCGGVTIN